MTRADLEMVRGQPSCVVRASGSDEAEPRQGKLYTDDGRLIDPKTGEIIAETAEKTTKTKEMG